MKTIEQILKEVGELNLVNEVSLPKVSTSLLNPTAQCADCKVQIIITLHNYLDEAYRWRKTITIKGMSREQAKVEEARIKAQVDDIVSESFANKGKHNLVESMERWIEALGKTNRYRPTTLYKMREQMKVIRKYYTLNPIYVEDYKTSNANRFYEWALDYGRFKPSKADGSWGLARRTVKELSQRLNTFFRFAVGQGILSVNPITDSEVPYVQPDNVEEQRKCWMDEDEYKLFRKWLMTVGQTKRKAHLYKLIEICDLMIYTGMRREELLGLKWDCFNYEKGTLTIQGVRVKTSTGDLYEKKTKNSPSYRVYILSNRIKMLLQNMRERQQALGLYKPDGFIFIWETNVRNNIGKEYYTDYPSHLFKLAIKDCEYVEDKSLHLHHLRHSCCSIMFKKGKKEEDTQAWLGHADGSTITKRVYNHYGKLQSMDIMKDFDDIFE